MRFGSLCSGIEAASAAWHPLGWRAAFLSEIEPFPCAVLAHHYPDVPNRGDMTKFKDWPDAAIDLLCGGTPCQSFSTAGLRKGLDDPRGNLMLTFGAVAARYRPRWLVWENVPGVLSSNAGRDFGAFLGLMGFLGYGFAYRVLDAQYVRVDGYARAVPQRRNRVFVVGCLGDWRSAAAVLLERESLRGDPAPRRSSGARVAPCIRAGAANGGAGHGARSGDSKDELITPVVFPIERGNQGSGGNIGFGDPCDPCYPLERSKSHATATATAVRRLTPGECEALQGFPQGYTAITYRGKPAADGPRYKALGNSWAVNCARWIGRRIEMVEQINAAQKAAA